MAVPTVDLAAYVDEGAAKEEREAVVHAFDRAMRSLGMVRLVNHGVPHEAVRALHGAAHQFFQAPLAHKMTSCLHKGYGSGGYVPVGVEAVARSRAAQPGASDAPPDLVENIVFSHGADPALEPVVPSEPSELQPAAATYWAHMRKLLNLLMRLSADALSLPTAFFDHCYAEPRCHLRLAHYPACSEERPAGTFRYGAHTDYTGFTILRQDMQANGLQVQTREGEWIAAPPMADGALLVNAGDLIAVWTNDRWRSPPHRVLPPPKGASASPLTSLVFFTGPSDETVVEALPGTVDGANPQRYPPISARAHLHAKLSATST